MPKSNIVEIFIPPHKHNKKASISIGFDDFTTFDMVAEMYLKRHNLRASVFLNTYYLTKIDNLLGSKFTQYWRDISKSGTINYSSHSVNHILPEKLKKGYSDSRYREELKQSRDTINSIFGKKCIGFAYPDGNTEMKGILPKYYLFGRSTRIDDVRHLEISEDKFSCMAVTTDALENVFLKKEEWRIQDALGKAKEKGGWVRLYGHLKMINKFKLWDKLDWLFSYISKDNEVYCGDFEDVASYLYLSRNVKILSLDNSQDDIIDEFKIITTADEKVRGLIDIDKVNLTVVIKLNNVFSDFSVVVDGATVPVILENGKSGIFWFELTYGNHTVKIRSETVSNSSKRVIPTPPKILDVTHDGKNIYVNLDRPADLTIYHRKEGKSSVYAILAKETQKKFSHCLNIPYLDYGSASLVSKRFRFAVACTDNNNLSHWDDNNGNGYLCRRIPSFYIPRLIISQGKKCAAIVLTNIVKQLIYLKNKYGAKNILTIILLFLGVILVVIVLFNMV